MINENKTYLINFTFAGYGTQQRAFVSHTEAVKWLTDYASELSEAKIQVHHSPHPPMWLSSDKPTKGYQLAE